MYLTKHDTYVTDAKPSDLTGGEDCFYVFLAINSNAVLAYSAYDPAIEAKSRRRAVDDWSRAIAAGFVDC